MDSAEEARTIASDHGRSVLGWEPLDAWIGGQRRLRSGLLGGDRDRFRRLGSDSRILMPVRSLTGRGAFRLADRGWAILEPLLPRQPRRGGQWRDHRQVVNGIAWVKRTGSPWRDLPERYGRGRPRVCGFAAGPRTAPELDSRRT